MMAELNLYTKKIKIINQRQKLKLAAVKGLVGLLIAATGLLMGLSSYSLILTKQNQIIDSKIKATTKKIMDLSETEGKQVYLLSKLKTFEDLIKSQAKHQAITETVFAVLPPGTNIRGFQVAETGEIKLSGSVADYATFNELLERIRKTKDYRLPIMKAIASRVNITKTDKSNEVSFEIDLTMAVKE